MRYEVTLESLQQTAIGLQSGGRSSNTALGLALVVAGSADAFLSGIGEPAISGLLLELTSLNVPYRVAFFVALILQVVLLLTGFRVLQASRWPASVSQTALAPLWASVRAGHLMVLGPRALDRGALVGAVFAGALVVAALMAWGLASAMMPDDPASPLRKWGTLFAMVLLALLLASVLATLSLVCVADLQVLIGISAGLASAAVGAAYTSGSSSFGSGPSDLAAWEAGVLMVSTIFLLIFMWGSRSTRIVLVLKVPDGASAPLSYEYSPFSEHIIRPASLMFQVHGTKLLAFSRADNAPSYELIDTRDVQLATPLHDRSILFLNITALANRVRTTFDITDSGNCFALRGSVGLLATTVSFKQGGAQAIDRHALELVSDVLFINEDLSGLLSRPVERALERHVAPMRSAIADIRATIKPLPQAMSLAGPGTEYATAMQGAVAKETGTQRLDGLQSATIKRDDRKRLGAAFLQIIDEQLKRFNDLRSSLEGYTGALEDVWVAEMVEELRKRGPAKSHDQGSTAFSEVERVLNILGLRLNGLRLELIGSAAECQQELQSLRGEIEQRFLDAETGYMTQSGKRDDLLAQAVLDAIRNRSLRPSELADVLSRLASGGSAAPAVAAPTPAPQVNFDLDDLFDNREDAPPPDSPT